MTTVTLSTVVWLLLTFQLKHYMADYPLQNRYMLGKFDEYPNFIPPLLAHSGVNAVLTLTIVMFYTTHIKLALLCAFMDLVIHFTVDRVKASKKMLGRYHPEQPQFWWTLGLDQMCHHLTHYMIIIMMLNPMF